MPDPICAWCASPVKLSRRTILLATLPPCRIVWHRHCLDPEFSRIEEATSTADYTAIAQRIAARGAGRVVAVSASEFEEVGR